MGALPPLPRAGRPLYLAWTNVRNSGAAAFDLRNYLVTSRSIDGPWSEPIGLNASGFDPCIFFDDDGRVWVLNLEWEFRKGYEHPGWIALQEYSIDERRLRGRSAASITAAPTEAAWKAPSSSGRKAGTT